MDLKAISAKLAELEKLSKQSQPTSAAPTNKVPGQQPSMTSTSNSPNTVTTPNNTDQETKQLAVDLQKQLDTLKNQQVPSSPQTMQARSGTSMIPPQEKDEPINKDTQGPKTDLQQNKKPGEPVEEGKKVTRQEYIDNRKKVIASEPSKFFSLDKNLTQKERQEIYDSLPKEARLVISRQNQYRQEVSNSNADPKKIAELQTKLDDARQKHKASLEQSPPPANPPAANPPPANPPAANPPPANPPPAADTTKRDYTKLSIDDLRHESENDPNAASEILRRLESGKLKEELSTRLNLLVDELLENSATATMGTRSNNQTIADRAAKNIPEPVKKAAKTAVNNPVTRTALKFAGPAAGMYSAYNSINDFEDAANADAKGDKVGKWIKNAKGVTNLGLGVSGAATLIPATWPVSIPADIALAIASGSLEAADWLNDKLKEPRSKQDIEQQMSNVDAMGNFTGQYGVMPENDQKIKEDLNQILMLSKYKLGK